MGDIHFIGGEKGGVGKSVMSRVLAQYFIDRSVPITGFDSDSSHASFTRFYNEFAFPVILERFESMDAIIEVFEEAKENNIIVDLAAQSHKPLSRWILESDLFQATKELDIGIYFWHVMDDGKESVQLLGKLFDTYGRGPRYIIVQNEGRGAFFSQFEESLERKLARRFAAPIMTLPKLHKGTMQSIDRLNSSFWAAVNNTGSNDKALKLLERQRAKTWLKKTYRAIDEVLFPEAEETLN